MFTMPASKRTMLGGGHDHARDRRIWRLTLWLRGPKLHPVLRQRLERTGGLSYRSKIGLVGVIIKEYRSTTRRNLTGQTEGRVTIKN